MNTRFDIKIAGKGKVNAVEFAATGGGRCDTATGRIAFDVEFSRLARGSHPLANLLGVLIIPTVFGREHDGARNLMSLTGGNFEFTQVMTAKGIAVTSKGSMSRTADDEVTWRSSAEGTVRLADVSAIEPFSAVMLPRKAGHVVDVLSIPLVQRGRRLVVHAIRDFRFTPRARLAQHQIRHITVKPTVRRLSVGVAITSDIFPFPGAARLAR